MTTDQNHDNNFRHPKPLTKIPLYKNKKVFLILLLILLVMFVIVEIREKENEKLIEPINNEQTK